MLSAYSVGKSTKKALEIKQLSHSLCLIRPSDQFYPPTSSANSAEFTYEINKKPPFLLRSHPRTVKLRRTWVVPSFQTKTTLGSPSLHLRLPPFELRRTGRVRLQKAALVVGGF